MGLVFRVLAGSRATAHRVAGVGLLFLMAAALLSACDNGPKLSPAPEPTLAPTLEAMPTPAPEPTATHTPEPTATHTPEPTATHTPEPTATHTPEPTATYTPVPTATQALGPLAPAQIYERVSPSIASIETSIGMGSGVLTEGGHVVTNAHVVWPFDTARVVLPDGSEFQEVPVKGWDMLADLAVLGPIDTPTGALTLVDGEDLPIGSNVYLIDYPGEVREFPQPTIGSGLLTHVRESELVGITYLQTDAPVIGGQSGGALVSEMGEVIGISSFGFTDANFGLAGSSADILPRFRQIIAGGDPSGLGDRSVPLVGGEFSHEVVLGILWDRQVYVINESPGTVVAIAIDGEKDGAITVYDLFGSEVLYLDEDEDEDEGSESGSFVVEHGGPHFLVVEHASDTPSFFTLTGSSRLIELYDPDDGKQLQLTHTVVGNLDYPGDIDHFHVNLREGEIIEVVARSVLVDTFLFIDYYHALELTRATVEQIIADDDSGGGLSLVDAKIVYRAPHTGSYYVVVQSSWSAKYGGYTIKVDRAGPGAVLTQTTLASE